MLPSAAYCSNKKTVIFSFTGSYKFYNYIIAFARTYQY